MNITHNMASFDVGATPLDAILALVWPKFTFKCVILIRGSKGLFGRVALTGGCLIDFSYQYCKIITDVKQLYYMIFI